MTPLLSILICSIPSRFQKLMQLHAEISALVEDRDIEILILTDNKARSIGAKREALKNICNGKYFLYLDDDDSLYSLKEIYEACKKDVDVITYKIRCTNSSGKQYIVTVGLGNDIEHNNDGEGNYIDLKRPPFTQAAWNKKFKSIPFPDKNYAEDTEWGELANREAKTEIHIDEVLQGYNFDPAVSEAVVSLPPPKRCVVNLATAQFRSGQTRLHSAMLRYNQDIPLLLFGNEYEVFAPPHRENPYAFKIYAIDAAREMGYDQVLWFDSSVYPVGSLAPVFDWLTEKGIFLEEAGHYLGQWSNDETLNYFKISRQDAMKMPMLSAGFIGFDFRNPISLEFFAEWKESMRNGMFKGLWENHRHDLTCASAIANLKGLVPLYSHGGQFFAYVGPGFGEPGPKVVAELQGM